MSAAGTLNHLLSITLLCQLPFTIPQVHNGPNPSHSYLHPSSTLVFGPICPPRRPTGFHSVEILFYLFFIPHRIVCEDCGHSFEDSIKYRNKMGWMKAYPVELSPLCPASHQNG